MQKKQNGTGDAVMQCKQNLHDFEGHTLVLSGDAPLIQTETLMELYNMHITQNAQATILSAKIKEPHGYGRIIRKNGDFISIIEEKDANEMQKNIKEINGGIYIFNNKILFKNIDKIIATGSDNTARYFEYYFAKYPSVIRKSRTSVAVIHEGFSEGDIHKLAEDMFQYYGLGCRNVSKLFLPKGFNVPYLIDHLRAYEAKMDNVKYYNNLEYHKSINVI